MNLARLYHTLRPLRTVQWTDRLLRPLRARMLRTHSPSTEHLDAGRSLAQVSLPRFATSDIFDPISGGASFLNLYHRFDPRGIDWNFSSHGKLWTYHLNYFGWLERLDDAATVLTVMQDFCRRTNATNTGTEIYPASRRIQHWISATLQHGLRDEEILARLYADAWRVARLPEHHLQANHLLQNAFAIFAAAHFFDDRKLFHRAKNLLLNQLARQVLPDGGHIERSASYTTDLCARLLWCLHLQRHTSRHSDPILQQQMRHAATRMVGWLEAYAFPDGSLAAIGDSSPDMMPPLHALKEAADALGISAPKSILRESGYRKVLGKHWEAVVNVGSPTPAYQPGHSHADALTFCIHAYEKPLVVDAGISTYERTERRAWERSTEAHNTVVVDRRSSSDVWASFRMGKRARVQILGEESSIIVAAHGGCQKPAMRHERWFDSRSSSRVLRIADALGRRGDFEVVSFLHFHPDVHIVQTGNRRWRANRCRIFFLGMSSVTAESYQWAAGFNLLRPATRLRCVWGPHTTAIRFTF